MNTDLRRRVEGTARQLAARGIDIEQFLSATGQDANSFVERLRPESEQAVRLDLALRAVAAAEAIDADDDDVAAEYQRIAMQTGQKAARVRDAYESRRRRRRDSCPDPQVARRSTGCSTTSSSSIPTATPSIATSCSATTTTTTITTR